MERIASRLESNRPAAIKLRNRKRQIQYDERRYKDQWRVEAMFCRLLDFRRITTRYDKLARSFLSALGRAAVVVFWL
jgi:transposase